MLYISWIHSPCKHTHTVGVVTYYVRHIKHVNSYSGKLVIYQSERVLLQTSQKTLLRRGGVEAFQLLIANITLLTVVDIDLVSNK